MKAGRRRLLVAATIPETAWTLMRGQLRFLQENGFDIVLVSAPASLLDQVAERESVAVRGVEMERELAPCSDVGAVWRMMRVIRAEEPDISLVGTPKAGLVAGLGAWLARVPRRIYLLRGLRLETEHGLRRAVLWLAEWIAMHVAHEVVVVSPSLLERTRALRLLGRTRGIVLGSGASNGVDVDRFAPSPSNEARGRRLRAELDIPASAFVFGFVGRMAVDKGIGELVQALGQVQRMRADVWLLVAGAEELSGLPPQVHAALDASVNVRFTGWVDDTVPAYHAMDCLVLPTYREGFPNVPLEAAAAGRSVITTTATGAVDSVRHEQTGLLVSPRSAAELAEAMERLVLDPGLARSLGSRGREFVSRYFTNAVVWQNLLDHLRRPE